MIKRVEMQVGRGELVGDFISRASTAPEQIKELTLVSPFVQLTTGRGTAGYRLMQLLRDINAAGGVATLISDSTSARRLDFSAAIAANPVLGNTLMLCKDLHAKCGVAASHTGNNVGFLGSANLTDPGLHHNAEVVFTVNSRRLDGPSWQLLGQLRLVIDGIRSRSFYLN